MRLFALLFHDNLTYITKRFKSTQIKAILRFRDFYSTLKHVEFIIENFKFETAVYKIK